MADGASVVTGGWRLRVVQRFEAHASGGFPLPWWVRFLAAGLATSYGLVQRVRDVGYCRGWWHVDRLPGRVISIGNLVVGGSGKSPVTIALAKQLVAGGARVAILTRGYGSGLHAKDSLVLLNGRPLLAPERSATSVSQDFKWPDEARMASAVLPTVPVICGARRYEAAQRYLKVAGAKPPTHWLLDDGFQHRRLARDVDLVLVAANRPFGNGRLLPLGPLREPPSALTRATMVLRTEMFGAGSDRPAPVTQQVPEAGVRFRNVPPISAPSGGPAFGTGQHTPVLLVTGIAHPERVSASLERLGVPIGACLRLADHQPIERPTLLGKIAAHSPASVVTTAKDYWRNPECFADLPVPVFILPLFAEFSPADFAAIDRLVMG